MTRLFSTVLVGVLATGGLLGCQGGKSDTDNGSMSDRSGSANASMSSDRSGANMGMTGGSSYNQAGVPTGDTGGSGAGVPHRPEGVSGASTPGASDANRVGTQEHSGTLSGGTAHDPNANTPGGGQ